MNDVIDTTAQAMIGTEIWVPGTDYANWELIEATYQPGCSVRPQASARPSTPKGLPEKAVEAGSYLTEDLGEEWETRGDIMVSPHIGAGMAIPFYNEGKVSAVLILFFHNHSKCAAELWSGRTGSHELCLQNGFYPGLERFGNISKHVFLPHGSGMPGRAWRSGLPQLMRDIGGSKRFLRSSGAESEGLSSGLSIPIINNQTLDSVVCLLSAPQCPIASVYEIWRPVSVNDSPRLALAAGHYGTHTELETMTKRLSFAPGEDIIGKVWSTGMPTLREEFPQGEFARAEYLQKSGLMTSLTIPLPHWQRHQRSCSVILLILYTAKKRLSDIIRKPFLLPKGASKSPRTEPIRFIVVKIKAAETLEIQGIFKFSVTQRLAIRGRRGDGRGFKRCP